MRIFYGNLLFQTLDNCCDFFINAEWKYIDKFPSCLILGKCLAGKPLHVVTGLDTGVLSCMITAYRPDLEKWENDFKTRKAGK